MKFAHLFAIPMFLFSRLHLSNGFLGSSKNVFGSLNNINNINNIIKRTKKTTATTAFYAASKKSIKTRSISPLYTPKTENQQQYFQYLSDPKCSVVIAYGSAGTGKTLFACSQAVEELRTGRIQKIILTRPIVSVDKEELGFLPGNIVHKMDPWTRPLFDILLEYYSQKDIDSMLHGGVLEISPLAYMRGRTFKRAFIIADEMQNSSPNQMLMLATRIGSDSRMVITGDLKQSDRGNDNGLRYFIHKLQNSGGSIPEIKMIEMMNEDVQRSQIVSKILDLFSDAHSNNIIKTNHNCSNNSDIISSNKSVSCSSDCFGTDIGGGSVFTFSDSVSNSVSKSNGVSNSVSKSNGVSVSNSVSNSKSNGLSESNSVKDSVNVNDDAALLPTKYISIKQRFVWDPTQL